MSFGIAFPSASSLLLGRANQADLGASAPIILRIWLACQIFAGHIFLPILVIIFCFSPKAKRHPTLINLCITWIISGIASSFLLYTGTQEGPEPPIALCLAQTSLIYGIPAMGAMSVLALVFQVFVGVASATNERLAKPDPGLAVLRTAALLVSPYILFGVFATATAAIGYGDPAHVTRSRRFLYCSLQNSPLTNAMASAVALLLISAIFLEGWITVLLYRNWRALRRAGAGTGLDFSLILRVVVFGIYVLLGTCLSLLSIVAPKSVVPDLWLASVGPVIVFIFGTQRDIFRAFIFWRKEAEVTKVARLPYEEREKGSYLV